MKITIDTIPHSAQRYDTIGDWLFDEEGNMHITVSDMGNRNYEFLIGIHEAIEAWLCRENGVSDEEVTAFDIEFEKNRVEGNKDEPGDDPDAPYRSCHFFATSIERLLSQMLNVDWNKYEDTATGL